jgi:hypothetical protein
MLQYLIQKIQRILLVNLNPGFGYFTIGKFGLGALH